MRNIPLDVEMLSERYGPMVLRRCRYLLKDEDEAMDVCQDVFVRIIEQRDRLDAGHPSSLLYVTATHLCLNRIRSRNRHAIPTDDTRLEQIASAEEPAGQSEARLLLDRLFRRHPASSRTIAVLHYLDGLTLEQVAAEAAGSSLSAALRSRLLDPLGLTSTFLLPEESLPGTLAHGWFDLNGDGSYDDLSVISRTSQVSAVWAAGGMVATAADVARWACALFEGKVLSADSLNQMLQFREVSLPPSPIVGYGLGALRSVISGRVCWGHGGDMIGYTAIMIYAPQERISIALLFNQDYVDYALGPELLDPIVAAVRP